MTNCPSDPAMRVIREAADRGEPVALRFLEHMEQKQVPESIDHTYRPVTHCEKCGSTDIVLRVIYNRPKTLGLRVFCLSCSHGRFLPCEENLAKRTNTTLAHWAQNVIRRDGGKCVICGSEKKLQAHHIIPVANDPEGVYKYDERNGITLCDKCHAQVHRKGMGSGDA